MGVEGTSTHGQPLREERFKREEGSQQLIEEGIPHSKRSETSKKKKREEEEEGGEKGG